MNVENFSQALALLPAHYLALPCQQLRTCVYDNKLVAAHADHPPLVFANNIWGTIPEADKEVIAPHDE